MKQTRDHAFPQIKKRERAVAFFFFLKEMYKNTEQLIDEVRSNQQPHHIVIPFSKRKDMHYHKNGSLANNKEKKNGVFKRRLQTAIKSPIPPFHPRRGHQQTVASPTLASSTATIRPTRRRSRR